VALLPAAGEEQDEDRGGNEDQGDDRRQPGEAAAPRTRATCGETDSARGVTVRASARL